MCLIVLEDTEKSSRTLSLSREPLYSSKIISGLPWWLSGKESACQCRGLEFSPWSRKIPWRRKWQPTPVFLPRKSHGQRSLVGYSPWGCKEPDVTERLTHTHTAHEHNTLLVAGSWEGSALFGSCRFCGLNLLVLSDSL